MLIFQSGCRVSVSNLPSNFIAVIMCQRPHMWRVITVHCAMYILAYVRKLFYTITKWLVKAHWIDAIQNQECLRNVKNFHQCTRSAFPFKKLFSMGPQCERNYAISNGNAYVARFNVLLQSGILPAIDLCVGVHTCESERDSMKIAPSKVSIEFPCKNFSYLEQSFQ